jgi:hypothetical protein
MLVEIDAVQVAPQQSIYDQFAPRHSLSTFVNVMALFHSDELPAECPSSAEVRNPACRWLK